MVSERGPQGEQGERGATGTQLSPRLRRSLVYLFGLAVVLAAFALFAQIHGQDASQAAQRQAGVELEQQLCATFGRAAALKPPAGNPRTNPSRAYLQGQHTVWTEVVADLHCDQLPRN